MPTDWTAYIVTTIISALIGAAVIRSIAISREFALNRVTRLPEPFFDKYNAWYYSSKGDRSLIKGECEIKHGRLQSNLVTLTLWNSAGREQKFEGRAERRDKIVYVHASDPKSKEEITLILKVEVDGKLDCRVGILCGLSVKDIPCATHILLSKTRHPERLVRTMLPVPTLITADDPLPSSPRDVPPDASPI